VELELTQLDRRYESMRKANPAREKRLLASMAELGQQSPVVVVALEPGRYVLVDGYKRVRALSRLRCDLVQALQWDLPEADALVFERLMRESPSDVAIEQGWLLVELRDRFGLCAEQLARRFDKSASWVSRRLSLVSDLPQQIQQLVRKGKLGAHSAMKYLVPLARANSEAAIRLSTAIAPLNLSSRQVGQLSGALLGASDKSRELLLSDPCLFLRAQKEVRSEQNKDKKAAELILTDLAAFSAIARRVVGRLRKGITAQLLPCERDQVQRCLRQARADSEQLFDRLSKENLA
jgi:ParB family chromosome partitioning protein